MDSSGPLLATHFLLEKQVEGRASSFDHLVGAGEQRRRHFEAEGPSGLEVNDQFVLCGGLHRQVGRFLALEDAVDVTNCPTVLVDAVRCIGEQPTLGGEYKVRI